MSRGLDEQTEALASFPRVSGDEPHTLTFTPPVGAFSPRERG